MRQGDQRIERRSEKDAWDDASAIQTMPIELDIDKLRSAAMAGRIHWRQHALERLLERGITGQEVRTAIAEGTIIEIYSSHGSFTSCLILHVGPQPLHVVLAHDPDCDVCHVITAYRPGLDRFEPDFKTRRSKP